MEAETLITGTQRLSEIESRRVFDICREIEKIAEGKYFDKDYKFVSLDRKQQIAKLKGKAAALLSMCDFAEDMQMMEVKQ